MQQNSVPVLLLVAVLMVQIEDRKTVRIYWREHVLLGMSALSLLFFYPEIMPMVLFGSVLFLGVHFWHAPGSGRRLWGYLATLGILAAGILPMLELFARYARAQLSHAVSSPSIWRIVFFKWLYADPLTGIWGFGPLVMQPAIHILLLLPAIVLTLALVAGMARPLWSADQTSTGLLLAASFSFAACLEWLYLVLQKQYWAGAKGLSFGYVFLILTVLGFIFAANRRVKSTWGRTARNVAAVCAVAWLLVQFGLALYRPWLAFAHQDYTNYVYGHGEYQHHDWDLKTFDAILRDQNGTTVWSDVSNSWLSEYIELALGWDVHVVNIGASRDSELEYRAKLAGQELHLPHQSTSQRPQYLIAETSRIGAGAPLVVARTSELSLVKCPVDRAAIILSVHNPNGNEGTQEEPFFWLGRGQTTIEFLSFDTAPVIFKCRLSLGPSCPGRPYRHLVLTSSGPEQRITVSEGTREFRFPAVRGVNRAMVEVEDRPTFFLPADSRPLLLRMDRLDIGGMETADSYSGPDK